MAMPASAPHYTIDMLDAMPQEPGVRYELVDGSLIVTPAPGKVHARLVKRILIALSAAIPDSVAEVATPGEIRKGATNSLQPDVLVYPTDSPFKDPWKAITAWWLAVEVVSPSSRGYDSDEKRRAYLDLGVQAYWVVDPETRTVAVWRPGAAGPGIVRDRLTWTAPSGHRLEIKLEELFGGIET